MSKAHACRQVCQEHKLSTLRQQAQKAHTPALPVTLSLMLKNRSKAETIGSRLSETGVTCYHCAVWRRTLWLSTRFASVKMTGSVHMVACTVPAQTLDSQPFTLRDPQHLTLHRYGSDQGWDFMENNLPARVEFVSPITQIITGFFPWLSWLVTRSG